LPLAIELAARSKLFAPEALLACLSSRLALLTGGARNPPVRQQTIRNTLAWSYDLLNETEQMLLQRAPSSTTISLAAAWAAAWMLTLDQIITQAPQPDGIESSQTPLQAHASWLYHPRHNG